MKSYGQIAHDKGAELGGWHRKWEDMDDRQKIEWEAIAEAVINAFEEKEDNK
jgi:hypothetical protein